MTLSFLFYFLFLGFEKTELKSGHIPDFTTLFVSLLSYFFCFSALQPIPGFPSPGLGLLGGPNFRTSTQHHSPFRSLPAWTTHTSSRYRRSSSLGVKGLHRAFITEFWYGLFLQATARMTPSCRRSCVIHHPHLLGARPPPQCPLLLPAANACICAINLLRTR